MKKIKTRKWILLFLVGIIIVIGSCEELTQPLLTDEHIMIIAPVDSLITTTRINTFAWEPVEGATNYQVQIVSPKFDSVVRFVVDSTFSNSTFTYTLIPGVYQWRIRASNPGSQTNYFIRSITIQ